VRNAFVFIDRDRNAGLGACYRHVFSFF